MDHAPAQVHLVAMPFPAMPAALAAGKIDAAYETEPFVTETVRKYGALAVADMDSGAAQDFPLTGYAALASWAAKYPRTAAAFTKAVEQGNATAATNLAVLQRVLSTSLHLSPDITGVMATGTFPTSASPAQIQRAVDLMLQYGQLREPFNVKSLMGLMWPRSAPPHACQTGLAAGAAQRPWRRFLAVAGTVSR